MRGRPSEELRDARTVEISSALFLGGGVVAFVLVGVWAFGRFVLPPRSIWDPIAGYAPIAAVVLGCVVVAVRLVRARQREM